MDTLTINGSVGLLDAASLPPITCNYLLVINIPLYRDEGNTLAGHLWFKDLVGHVAYLRKFAIACPILDAAPTEVAVPLSTDERFAFVDIIELPVADSWFLAVLTLPRTVVRLWRAIRNADIIHTGVAGWPMPCGWIVTPIAKILGKKLVIIVESAPWRLNVGRPRTIKSVLTSIVYETLARWCVGRSDLAIFTNENYRESLLRHGRKTGHIIHASWIDEEVVLSDEEAHDLWHRKLNVSPPLELKILFAGRLDRQKGLAVCRSNSISWDPVNLHRSAGKSAESSKV
jgi:glycosyltransferase involved in cell wall biosynthesis